MKLTDLAQIAVLIILSAITLSVGTILTTNMGASTSAAPTSTETVILTNVSFSNGNYSMTANETWGQPASCVKTHESGRNDGNFAIPSKCNFTYGIGKGWKACDDNRCFPTFIITVNNATADIGVNITYTKVLSDNVYQTLSNATLGQAQLSSWLPTISLVVAAAIIIGIVFGSFILGRRE